MTQLDERKFVTFNRGHVRDRVLLAAFRNRLRGRTNPDTGQPFTEDEIAYITQPGSRFHIEADGIDLYGQAMQSRALWFVDQVDPRKASDNWLQEYHGKLWLGGPPLPASGGSGVATATGNSPGTVFVGSATIGDPSAKVARDPAGNRYQVLLTTAANSQGTAVLRLAGIDGGSATNLRVGTVLTWVTPPLGAAQQFSVTEAFTGGFPQESSAAYANRIVERIRAKPGAGNAPQFRAWARESTGSVQDAFVYQSAFHAGSGMTCVVQRRSSDGPLGRIPTFGTLAIVGAYLIPPASPVNPEGDHHVVVPPVPQSVDFSVRLALRRASPVGWFDALPWPTIEDPPSVGQEYAVISAVASQTSITVDAPEAPLGSLPLSGTALPSVMVWDNTRSVFERLAVQEIASAGGTLYTFTLSAAPTTTLTVGQVISPYTELSDTIGQTFVAYFDELGPGEVVPLTDPRRTAAARYPDPAVEAPTDAGQDIISRLDDSLGGALSSAEVIDPVAGASPAIPSNPIVGPSLLVIRHAAIYPFNDR